MSAEVFAHPTLKPSIEKTMVLLCGGRSKVKNIVAAVEWDDGTAQVISNQMQLRDLAYLSGRVWVECCKELGE